MIQYVCSECQCIYRPEMGDEELGIEPGTAFEDLSESWECPRCGASKDTYLAVQREALEYSDIELLNDEQRALMSVYYVDEDNFQIAPLEEMESFFGNAHIFDASGDLLETFFVGFAGEKIAHSIELDDIAYVVFRLDAGETLDAIRIPEGAREHYFTEIVDDE